MGDRSLRMRLGEVGRLVGADLPASPGSGHPRRYHTLADALGGELVCNHAGAYCVVETAYPLDYRHGDRSVDALLSSGALPLSAFTMHDEPGVIEPTSMLLLDTETTGLGGSGVVAFLVAVGSLSERGLTVRQYLIPDYSDEAAMLEAVLELCPPSATLVTYNGKAFDVPILRDRMIVNRVARDFGAATHVDLLHSVRRLFGRRLTDCSLGSVERNMLGFSRRDDIPGYLVPSVYFEWLTEEKLDDMSAVLEHNRLDIVSLAFLAVLVADVFRSRGETLDEPADLHSLARIYRRRRQDDAVAALVARVDQNVGPESLSDDMLLFHARVFLRGGDWERAALLWRRLASRSSREAYWANLELAKLHEHRLRDYSKALDHTRRAEAVCPYGSRHREALARRLERLRGRLELPASTQHG